VNYRKSSWAAFWSVACVVSLGGLAGCGGEDEPTGQTAPTPDASVDAAADAKDGGGLSPEAKAAACHPADAQDLILACACQACPTAAYDCYIATDTAATQCQAILGCAQEKGCKDQLSCMTPCGTVIAANQGGLTAAAAFGTCVATCMPATEAGPDVKTDAPVTSDAPVESSTPDATPDTAAPDSSSDATTDTTVTDSGGDGAD
jgi:hypothetical protein